MISAFQKLKRHAKRWGWRRTALRAAMDGIGRTAGLHLCYVRVRSVAPEPAEPIVPDGIVLRELDQELLLAQSAESEMHLDKAFIQSASERGDRAFGAFENSKLVAYVWRSTTAAPHVAEVWVRVEKPYCYSYKSFTRPEYRGKRIAPALMLHADQRMYELGFTHRAAFIDITNYASLAMSPHIDSEVIGFAGYISKLGVFRSFRSRAVADIDFEFFRRSNN